MKILVFVDRFIIGGVPVNCIEINAALHDFHGHEVVLFGTPGPMVKFAEEKGLRFLPAPYPEARPSPARMSALCKAVRREQPDLIQVWDWKAVLDAYFSVHLLMRIPMHVVMSTMEIDRLLPKTLPTTLMTPELVDQARTAGRGPVELLLPPVDVHLNAPGVVDLQPFIDQYEIRSDEITLVTVSRLDNYMKAESLYRTLDAVRILGCDLPVRFIVVGGGDARIELEGLASKINAELGRSAVVFTGPLLDPRPAYAIADIVIGMGGSALRGMAFGKPVIIVGARGFSCPFTPTTAQTFYYKGMYGFGDGATGSARLVADIRSLVDRADELSALGKFSRQFVVEHFSLEVVTQGLEKFLCIAVTDMPGLHVAVADGLRTAAIVMGWKIIPDGVMSRLKKHRLDKLRGQ